MVGSFRYRKKRRISGITKRLLAYHEGLRSIMLVYVRSTITAVVLRFCNYVASVADFTPHKIILSNESLKVTAVSYVEA